MYVLSLPRIHELHAINGLVASAQGVWTVYALAYILLTLLCTQLHTYPHTYVHLCNCLYLLCIHAYIHTDMHT